MRDHQRARRSMPEDLLHRADAAAREAGELLADWFWIKIEMATRRAERLSTAVERAALAADRMI